MCILIVLILLKLYARINMFYLCYKNFDNKRLREELQRELPSVADFESAHIAFKVILNRRE